VSGVYRRTHARSSTGTTIVEPLLIDTNILIEATDTRRRFHADATTLVQARSGLVFPAQVIREYLVVATRPVDANGLGLLLPDALGNIAEFRKSIRLLPEERPVLATFLRLLAAAGCTGARIHDAHLVATAVVHRVRTIVSLNPGDLLGITTGISVLAPAEALRGLAGPIQRGKRRPPRR
jgi:predicted nucleic acid-binding protein